MVDNEEDIFSDEPVGVDPKIVEKISKKSPTKIIFRFIKKIRWVLLTLVGIILITGGVYFFLPEVSIGDKKIVNLNTEFRLEKDTTVSLKDGRVSVRIVNFINDSCPEGVTCFWSGQAVQYSMTIDGKEYATGSVTKATDAIFDIETVSSDYETYANIKIIKID